MPFQPGNTYGGKRQNAGRPNKQDVEAAERAEEVFKRIVEGRTAAIAGHYSKRIFKNDAVLLDARKKLWPDELDDTPTGPTFNVIIGGQVIQPGSQSDVRPNSFQIRLGGNNGHNGNGSDGA